MSGQPSFFAGLSQHLILVPFLLPMLTAALMLLLDEKQRRLKAVMNSVSAALCLLAAVMLLERTGGPDGAGTTSVYLAANWAAPFGITLVADRLSTLMLVLGGVLGLASAMFSAARWDKAGVHFHPLFQLQLMGLNGAFLTGDLFNLFVCFEIMLAASYGLLLHGSGRTRVQAGLHYIAINLAASSLFLIGAAMLYGVTGTLNMADMAARIAQVAPADRGLLHAAAAILSVAFLAKAAMWPLNFWLVPAYGNATAPVGALFAILTKVGIYTIVRLWTLMFPETAGDSAFFGGDWLFWGGIATLTFGAVGMLGSQRPGYLAGFAIITSSGTLLAAASFGQADLTAGALYYLLSSTLAASIFLLLTDVVERWRNDGSTFAPYESPDDAPFLSADFSSTVGVNLDEEEEVLIGRPIPAAAAFLGLAFLCCALLIAGLPPLSGFLGKFAMLSAVLGHEAPATSGWIFMGALLASGLVAMIALSRVGIRTFWATSHRAAPQLRLIEGVPLAALVIACVMLTVQADTVMRYTASTARALHEPTGYITAVLSAKPRPGPSTIPNPEAKP